MASGQLCQVLQSCTVPRAMRLALCCPRRACLATHGPPNVSPRYVPPSHVFVRGAPRPACVPRGFRVPACVLCTFLTHRHVRKPRFHQTAPTSAGFASPSSHNNVAAKQCLGRSQAAHNASPGATCAVEPENAPADREASKPQTASGVPPRDEAATTPPTVPVAPQLAFMEPEHYSQRWPTPHNGCGVCRMFVDAAKDSEASGSSFSQLFLNSGEKAHKGGFAPVMAQLAPRTSTHLCRHPGFWFRCWAHFAVLKNRAKPKRNSLADQIPRSFLQAVKTLLEKAVWHPGTARGHGRRFKSRTALFVECLAQVLGLPPSVSDYASVNDALAVAGDAVGAVEAALAAAGFIKPTHRLADGSCRALVNASLRGEVAASLAGASGLPAPAHRVTLLCAECGRAIGRKGSCGSCGTPAAASTPRSVASGHALGRCRAEAPTSDDASSRASGSVGRRTAQLATRARGGGLPSPDHSSAVVRAPLAAADDTDGEPYGSTTEAGEDGSSSDFDERSSRASSPATVTVEAATLAYESDATASTDSTEFGGRRVPTGQYLTPRNAQPTPVTEAEMLSWPPVDTVSRLSGPITIRRVDTASVREQRRCLVCTTSKVRARLPLAFVDEFTRPAPTAAGWWLCHRCSVFLKRHYGCAGHQVHVKCGPTDIRPNCRRKIDIIERETGVRLKNPATIASAVAAAADPSAPGTTTARADRSPAVKRSRPGRAFPPHVSGERPASDDAVAGTVGGGRAAGSEPAMGGDKLAVMWAKKPLSAAPGMLDVLAMAAEEAGAASVMVADVDMPRGTKRRRMVESAF